LILWLDAQLPPKLALWIEFKFGIKTLPLRELGLRDAKDIEIFQKAKEQNVVIMTKDRDFLELYFRFGSPPKVLLLNCGNITNNYLQEFLLDKLPIAFKLLDEKNIIEIG